MARPEATSASQSYYYPGQTTPPPAYGASYPTTNSPYIPGYGYAPPPLPADAPVLQYHPLAAGAVGLAHDIQTQPELYYSYVNKENRLIFARRAGFWMRLGATLLDLIVISIPYFFIATIINLIDPYSLNRRSKVFDETNTFNTTSSGWVLLVGMLLFFGYYVLTSRAKGQSLGKKAVKIRVMRLDGNPPDWGTALIRFLPGYLLSSNLVVIGVVALLVEGLGIIDVVGVLLGVLAFGWGFWWAGWDELKQCWHDKLARTLVVDTREYVEGIHFYIPNRSW
jgi:uncharacterized RDD family membrane protein YckC